MAGEIAMGTVDTSAARRVSMRRLIEVGPQPADSGVFARAPIGLGRATTPLPTEQVALSADESDFLREIGAL